MTSPHPSAPRPPAQGEPRAVLIAADAITLEHDGHAVVDGVSMQVHAGEIVTLVGPNGAGKTTLLRLLLGLIRPSSGRIVRHPGLSVGYLPQRMTLDPVMPLPVRRLMTLTHRAPEAAVLAALAETGVEHLIDAQVSRLSGGERQRVLLARALLRSPELLVLDEPVQGVDFAGETALYELIGSIRARRGCGILMVSHDLHVVMAATDRVLCLNRHICCAGTPETVSRHPEYVRLFGPRAAATLAVYPHRHDHGHSLAGEVVRLTDPTRTRRHETRAPSDPHDRG
jgi:zinc transport system ATP-binding protein